MNARYTINHNVKAGGLLGKNLAAKLLQEKEEKYNYQWYVLTDVEALDIFFLKCNKARN